MWRDNCLNEWYTLFLSEIQIKIFVSLEYSKLFYRMYCTYYLRTYLQKVKWDLRNYDALKDDVIKNIIRGTFFRFSIWTFLQFSSSIFECVESWALEFQSVFSTFCIRHIKRLLHTWFLALQLVFKIEIHFYINHIKRVFVLRFYKCIKSPDTA